MIINSDAKAIVVGEKFIETVNGFRPALGAIRPGSFIAISDRKQDGYLSYEEVLASGSHEEPGAKVDPQDVWIQLYTSGTTGKPKGVVRTHESYTAFYLINAVDLGFTTHDFGLIVMPFPGGCG